MEKLLFIILFPIVPINLLSQSLATNILFEQANVVFKGKVEKIRYEESDGEGDYFGISTIVENVYKNNFSDERIGISIKKLYIIDTIKQILTNHHFQLREGNSYVFFINKPNEFKEYGRFIYHANLADELIEGIPFSIELEKELESYDQLSYLYTNTSGSISFKIISQSSPVSMQVNVQKIKSRKGWNIIFGVSEYGENVLIKTRELNCICENTRIEAKKSYLFFLTPFEIDKFLITDRWIGVIELDQISKSILNYYKH